MDQGNHTWKFGGAGAEIPLVQRTENKKTQKKTLFFLPFFDGTDHVLNRRRSWPNQLSTFQTTARFRIEDAQDPCCRITRKDEWKGQGT